MSGWGVRGGARGLRRLGSVVRVEMGVRGAREAQPPGEQAPPASDYITGRFG